MKLHNCSLLLLLVLAFVCAAFSSAAEKKQHGDRIKLNEVALEFAKNLIHDGSVVSDAHGAWKQQRPSSAQENEFIRRHGFAEYAKWHLGIDNRYGENAKARYKFPYGDFQKIYRSALIAAQSRARQYNYHEIEMAAAELKGLVEKSDRRHKR